MRITLGVTLCRRVSLGEHTAVTRRHSGTRQRGHGKGRTPPALICFVSYTDGSCLREFEGKDFNFVWVQRIKFEPLFWPDIKRDTLENTERPCYCGEIASRRERRNPLAVGHIRVYGVFNRTIMRCVPNRIPVG